MNNSTLLSCVIRWSICWRTMPSLPTTLRESWHRTRNTKTYPKRKKNTFRIEISTRSWMNAWMKNIPFCTHRHVICSRENDGASCNNRQNLKTKLNTITNLVKWKMLVRDASPKTHILTNENILCKMEMGYIRRSLQAIPKN